MSLLHALWTDESGFVLSAEAVLIGTVGVVGATVGLNMAAHSVNEEMKDFAFAIRSLDQSYVIPAQSGCGAWTAGSCFQQENVEDSLADLCAMDVDAEKIEEVQKEIREDRTRMKELIDKKADRKEQAEKPVPVEAAPAPAPAPAKPVAEEDHSA